MSESARAAGDQRVERGHRTRERLLVSAREQFGQHGYDGTSIHAVLASAGVARGALYHHFSSKEALFDAVLERLVAEIATAAGRAARDHADPVEGLRAGCLAWIDAAMDPAVQRIALVDAVAVVGWTRCREIDERYILGGLQANLDQIAAQGRLPSDNVILLAHMGLAAVNEAVLMLARAHEPARELPSGKAAIDMLLTRLTHDPDHDPK